MRNALIALPSRAFRALLLILVGLPSCSLLLGGACLAQAPAAKAPAAAPATAPTAAGVADIPKWLAQAGAQCDAAYQRDVQAPFDAALGTLRKSYLASIMQAMEKAMEARKLDDSNDFRQEREKFLGAGHKPPDDDSDKPPEGVRAMRAVFRNQFAQIDMERYTRGRVLHGKCDPTFAQMELSLTQRQRTADASLVKAKREEMAKLWLKPPAQSAGEPKAGTTTKAPTPSRVEITKETIRDAVEWIYSVGGTIAMPDGKDGRAEKEMTEAPQLPNGPVMIAHITLDNAKLVKPVTDGDLAVLAGLRSVRFLDLRGIKVTDAAFGFLDGWKDVEKIHINGSQITDAVFAKFMRHEGLRNIQIRNTPGVTGRGCDKLLGLKSLNVLDLEKCGLTEEGLTAIGQLKGLGELLIPKNEITDAAVARLASLRSLRKLHIQETKVTPAGLAPLSGFRELDELCYFSPGLSDYAGAARQVGAIWPKLRAVRMIGGQLRPDMIEGLAPLRGLKALFLQSAEVSTETVAAVDKLPGVEELSITYSPTFVDEQLGGVAGLKKLRTLRLNNTKVTDAGILKLKTMKGLKDLEVRTTLVSAAGVTAFEKELPGCKVAR